MSRTTRIVLIVFGALTIGASLCTLATFAVLVFTATFPVYATETQDFPRTETLTNNVRIQELVLGLCRKTDQSEPPLSWGAAKLVVDNPGYWAKGIVAVTLPNVQGEVLDAISARVRLPGTGTVLLLDQSLRAGGHALNIAPSLVGQPQLGYRLTPQMAIWAQRNDILPEQLEWRPGDPSRDRYTFKILPIEYALPSKTVPQHSLAIQVTNTGSMPLYHTEATALVRAQDGRLVDILSSEAQVQYPLGKRIGAGAVADLSLRSLSRSGRCVGAEDPKGYRIELFVTAVTASGEPISDLQVFTAPL